jgi:hypothetical protein
MGTVVTIYTVHRNNDDHSNGEATEFCSTQAIADRVANGSGWYGGNAPVEERKAYCDGGKYYLLDARHTEPVDIDGTIAAAKAKARDAALAKLSHADREALGLK